MCILATDDEDVKDVALQIHFTLIQAFCCENDINILRVNNTRRLAEILSGGGGGGGDGKQSSGEPMDLHCLLVTVSVCISTRSITERAVPRGFPARVLSNAHWSGAVFQEELVSTCSCARSKHVRDFSLAQTHRYFSCGLCFACTH